MSITTFVCLVYGEPLARAFAVDINCNKLISHLKETIKKIQKPFFNDIPTKDIKLWKVEISDENNDKFHNLVLQNDDELLSTKKINTYFTKEPFGDHIHIIVSSPNLFSNFKFEKEKTKKGKKGKFEYFELFPHEKWSISHFIIWVKEQYNYSEDDNISYEIFYDLLHAISMDIDALQDVRDVAQRLLKRKKVSIINIHDFCIIAGLNCWA